MDPIQLQRPYGQSSLAERARTAYQHAIEAKGKEQMNRLRINQEANATRLVELMESKLGIVIDRSGVYFKEFDSLRPHVFMDGMEFTWRAYRSEALQLVRECEVCKEELLSVVGNIVELGAALEQRPEHINCRPPSVPAGPPAQEEPNAED